MGVLDFINELENFVPILRTLIIIVLLIIFFGIILNFIKKRLLSKAKTKKQISNIQIFSQMAKYIFILIVLLSAIFSYSGSWSGLGLSVGLLSAALGWALQKPITGIAAWMMIVMRRNFEIGDRIIIGTVKGDVIDITLTHVYIKEVGGIVAGEERSGRIIMIPNSILFEQNIINYTSKYELILDQVPVTVTYESNMDKAINIALKAAKKHTTSFIEKSNKEPYVRTYFEPYGMRVSVRYLVDAKRLQEFSSLITKEIYDRIKETKDVEIAYPHTEILFKDKTKRFT
ncbi:mechanosensitive ion channel family protein [Candidatus Woesearchaeota archaeon]|nr:mechanosensitive ion channel family protein [Candidatus Woesearchaeota archaeon]